MYSTLFSTSTRFHKNQVSKLITTSVAAYPVMEVSRFFSTSRWHILRMPWLFTSIYEVRHTVTMRGPYMLCFCSQNGVEFQVSKLLRGPNFPRVVEACTELPTPYVIYDVAQGSMLCPFETYTDEAFRTMWITCLLVLRAMHDSGVVHGDIHPQNMYVVSVTQVYLINYSHATVFTDFRDPAVNLEFSRLKFKDYIMLWIALQNVIPNELVPEFESRVDDFANFPGTSVEQASRMLFF